MNNNSSTFPRMKRSFDEIPASEQQAWSITEYNELNKVNPDDGLTFTGKTAMMIAYERMIESQKPESERLFNDFLAEYFIGDYGKRVSEMLACALIVIFDEKKDNGFLYEGHINYTAARTMLISEKYAIWIEKNKNCKPLQVLNLGSGVDTRAFWDERLKHKAITYLEVDTEPVNNAKNKVLEEQKKDGKLSEPFCERKSISMDFSTESVKDLPTKCNEGTKCFNSEIPTCWILEGLVMYLEKEAVDNTLKELSGISAKGSYLIINFSTIKISSHPDEHDKVLKELGWEREQRLFFGDEGFTYGRYPEGKEANKTLGFSFYAKVN